MAESHTEEFVRLEKLKQLRETGINPFAYGFNKADNLGTVLDTYKDLTAQEAIETT